MSDDGASNQPVLDESEGQARFNETIMVHVMIGNSEEEYALNADELESEFASLRLATLARLKRKRDYLRNTALAEEAAVEPEESEERADSEILGASLRESEPRSLNMTRTVETTLTSPSDAEQGNVHVFDDSEFDRMSTSSSESTDAQLGGSGETSPTSDEDAHLLLHSDQQPDVSEDMPSVRTEAIYNMWLANNTGEYPYVDRPFDDPNLPERQHSCIDDQKPTPALAHFEDLLDLYILAYRYGNENLKFDILRAWQVAAFKYKQDLPGPSMINKAFTRLPHTAPLLRYLLELYGYDWTTVDWYSFNDYEPRGPALERFLYGVALVRCPHASGHLYKFYEGWCNFHDHKSEAEESNCLMWRNAQKEIKGLARRPLKGDRQVAETASTTVRKNSAKTVQSTRAKSNKQAAKTASTTIARAVRKNSAGNARKTPSKLGEFRKS